MNLDVSKTWAGSIPSGDQETQEKLISVVVTTYNVGPYIGRCLETLVGQTHKNIELILVDDGSRDETLAVATPYLQAFPRHQLVVLPKNTPGGVGTPGNIGLDLCSGDYIAFADGDDWYETDMLESMVAVAERERSDFVMANYQNYDQSLDRANEPADAKRWALLKEQFANGEDLDVLRRHILRFTPVPWRKLYNGDFIRNNRLRFPEGEFFFEDNPFHWYCTIRAQRISILDKLICFHRVNRPGQTMSSNGKELLYFYRHYESIHRWLRENDEFEDYEVELVTWIVSQIEWTSQKIQRGLWPALYREVSAVLANHSLATIFAALSQNNVGLRGWSLVTAAKFENIETFVQTLLFGPVNSQAISDSTRNAERRITELERQNLRIEEDLKGLREHITRKTLTIERLLRAQLLFGSESVD